MLGSGLLKPWTVEFFGKALGSIYFRCSRRHRKIAVKNLTEVYRDRMTAPEIESMAKQVFINFTTGAFDFFRVISLTRDSIDSMVEIENREHLDNAFALGRGCIGLTAHFGNWEILARKLVIMGYDVSVIARDSDDPGMSGIAQKIRESGGYKVFDRDQSMLGVFKALKNNGMLGILPDQNDYAGIVVRFFSRPALTAAGPAIISLRTGAPIVPFFCRKVGPGKYKAKVYPPIDFTPTGDRALDERNLTQLVNDALEVGIRQEPSQWLWLHDRWKEGLEARIEQIS